MSDHDRLRELIATEDWTGAVEAVAETPELLEARFTEARQTPLHLAVIAGRREAVEALLAAGADIGSLNWLGLSPLAVAGFLHRDEFAARLEKQGVEPDLSAAIAWAAYGSAAAALERESGALAPKARYGRLLMFAAENNHAEAARWLLDHGADPDAVHDWWDNRLTALHPAASHGSLEVVRLLVERGADLTVRDQEFDATPLEWARYFEQDAVVECLEGAA